MNGEQVTDDMASMGAFGSAVSSSRSTEAVRSVCGVMKTTVLFRYRGAR